MKTRKIRKIKYLAVLGLLLFICGLKMNMKAEAKEKASATGLPIDEVNFPDQAFRGYLSTYVDQDGNGMLSKEERDAVKWIGNKQVSYHTLIPEEYSIYKYTKKTNAELNAVGQIRSFAGIEHFENLKEILLEETKVEELPLNNPKLQAVGIVADHLDFSMKNAKKLKYFRVEAKGNISVDWNNIGNLSYLSVTGDLRIPLDVIFRNKKLAFLNLNNVEFGEGKKGLKEIDFSSLPLLEEVWLWNPKEENQEPPVEALHFENNPALKRVDKVQYEAAKQLVLSGKAVYYEDEYDYAYQMDLAKHKTDVARQVEIKFQEEEELKGKKLKKGSIALTEENFPDVSFRVYLYRFADTDKDGILSKEEREAVTRIRNDYYNHEEGFLWNEANYYDSWGILDWKDEEMFTLTSKIASLKGIEHFPNLYEIQLKKLRLSPDIKEIVISNPKLKYVDLSFYGNVEKIDFSGCKSMRLCHIFPNLENKESLPVTVNFSKISSLTHLKMGNVDAFQAIDTLPNKEKLRLLYVWPTTPITEEDAALLAQLAGIKDLALYFPEAMEKSFWLETLDLSKMQNLKKVRFYFPFLKGMFLPNKSVKIFYNYGSWKDPLKIIYVK